MNKMGGGGGGGGKRKTISVMFLLLFINKVQSEQSCNPDEKMSLPALTPIIPFVVFNLLIYFNSKVWKTAIINEWIHFCAE